MAYVKWTFWITVLLIVAAFLHYTLPQRDIVRIVNTYEERQDLTDWTRLFWSVPDDQSINLDNRDVQFIQAVRPNGKAIVYRNEDTGWGWPPYFKFDTANLYTEANDAISTKDRPEWYVIRHYGWRNEFLSIFPNAISIRPIADPEAGKGVPWLNIVILTLLAALVWAVRVRWVRFRRRRIDPVLAEAGEAWDDAGDSISETRGRLGRWLDSWRS